MSTLNINNQLVTHLYMGGQEVLKIEDGNGNTLYEYAPDKTITLSYPSSDNDAFDYSTSDGESGSISTVGDSVDVVISYGETIDFTTAYAKLHIYINDIDQGNGPSYTYGYSDVSDGDVVVCLFNGEPTA